MSERFAISVRTCLRGFYITLRDGDGETVSGIADPLGWTFDASGDFDELLGGDATPRMNELDPHATTILESNEMTALAVEVDSLLAAVPDTVRGPGRSGQAWRGLMRFGAMVDRCAADSRSTLHVQGD